MVIFCPLCGSLADQAFALVELVLVRRHWQQVLEQEVHLDQTIELKVGVVLLLQTLSDALDHHLTHIEPFRGDHVCLHDLALAHTESVPSFWL